MEPEEEDEESEELGDGAETHRLVIRGCILE
jgi:hypothetical protein